VTSVGCRQLPPIEEVRSMPGGLMQCDFSVQLSGSSSLMGGSLSALSAVTSSYSRESIVTRLSGWFLGLILAGYGQAASPNAYSRTPAPALRNWPAAKAPIAVVDEFVQPAGYADRRC
jgi:hypothetical protein